MSVQATSRSTQAALSLALVAAGLACCVFLGVAIGSGQLVVAAVVLAGVVGIVLAPFLSLGQWCVLILLATTASRGLVAALHLPALVNFFHYPLVVAFVATAVRQPARSSKDSQRPGTWLLGLGAISLLSMVANGSHPLRTALFLTIVGEPLVVIWAITRWGPDSTARKWVGWTCTALLTVQVPIGIWQGLTLGWTDPVQGTLAGSGAGAHILAGLFAVTLLVSVEAMVARKLSRLAGLLMCLIALGMIIAAGANQVVIAIAPALIAASIARRPDTLGKLRSRRLAARVGAAVFGLILAMMGLVLIQTLSQSTALQRTERLARVGQLPETQLVRERMGGQPLQLLLGSGPGTTASRASLLLTPTMLKETSPLAMLHLPPTQDGLRMVAAARASQGGSAESFASGSLGFLGDVGVIGFGGMVLTLIGAWREVDKAATWLKPAVQGSILMTAILLFVDNWLEYPEYALPLAILLAFAMRPSPRLQTGKASA